MSLLYFLLHGSLAPDLLGLGVRLLAILLVPVNRRPSSAMAWLLAIFLIPYVGVIAFLLIGNPKLPKRRRAQQREVNAMIDEGTKALPAVVMSPGQTMRPEQAVSPGQVAPSGETASGQAVSGDAVSGDAGSLSRTASPGQTVPPELEWMEAVATLNRNLGSLPMVPGNAVTLLEDYGDSIAQMAAAVDAAQRHVLCQFYIMSVDATTEPFFAALERAVQRGVTVHVLLDHIGSRPYPGYRRTLARLDAIGAEWRLMLPVLPLRGQYQRPDLRNHRKLLIVDGEVGFIGSLNMIDRSYQKPRNVKRGLQWQELVARVEGPTVRSMSVVFLTDWYSETGDILTDRTPPRPRGTARSGDSGLHCQIVPSGPGFDNDNNLKLFNSLIYHARRRVSLASPYFVPDESLMMAITTAAQRGVEVELFVNEVGDQPMVHHAQRSYYEVLLRAGVRIHLYPAPYILHAKHFTIDDEVAVIGSSNMDMRSFGLNLEVTMMTFGESHATAMRAVEDHYRQVSRELTLDEHLSHNVVTRLFDNLARLTSALQ